MDKNINTPQITVLMPVYNGEKYLKEAIDSILLQTFKDFEFIIINDGSTDESSNIIKQYNDKRIKILSNPKNIGLTKSLNKGLKISQGEYIARMDADDISHPDRFKEQYIFLEKNKDVYFIGAGSEIIDDIGNVYKMRIPSQNIFWAKWKLLFNNPFIHSLIFFRKKILDDIIGYNESEEYYLVEDYEFISRISKKYKISNIKKILFKHRFHNKSISFNNKNIQIRNYQKVSFDNINEYLEDAKLEDVINFNTALEKGRVKDQKKLQQILIFYNKILKSFCKKNKLNLFNRIIIILEYLRLYLIILKKNSESGINLPHSIIKFYRFYKKIEFNIKRWQIKK